MSINDQSEFDKIKCNYLKCYAGMGVAGRLNCFLGGDYTDKNCKNFKDEEEELERLRKENKVIIK